MIKVGYHLSVYLWYNGKTYDDVGAGGSGPAPARVGRLPGYTRERDAHGLC